MLFAISIGNLSPNQACLVTIDCVRPTPIQLN